ncbi:hypothetical protein KA005_14430 [bacterium]|nr:hypothetical protein [bacterium]
MAIYTQLSVTATPGKPHSFSAKTPAAAGPHTGLFTELSVSALPGAIHSFTAKTPEGEGVHEGQFTALSVIALPSGRHVFLPKEFVEPTPPAPPVPYYGGGGGGGGIWASPRDYEYERKAKLKEEILRDDRELLELLSAIIPILN